jgi:hypothetical protein
VLVLFPRGCVASERYLFFFLSVLWTAFGWGLLSETSLFLSAGGGKAATPNRSKQRGLQSGTEEGHDDIGHSALYCTQFPFFF